MTYVKPIRIAYISCCLPLFLCNALWAGNLTINPEISIGYGTTDNLTLAGDNEVSDQITEITPATEIIYNSEKITGNIDYQIQSLIYSENSDNDETFQQLSSFISAEVFNDIFWINVANNIDQRSISDTADQQQDNIFANDNITDVNDLIVQPLLRVRKSNINYELSASFAEQRFDGDTQINQVDSDAESYNANISSDNNSRFNWGVNYSSNETEFEDNTDNKISNTEGFLNVRLSSPILATITIGKDDNDFDTTDVSILNDEYWSTSLTWSPNSRFSLLLSKGRRFNTSDDQVAINYQGRKLTLLVSSERELISNGINNLGLQDNNDAQAILTPLTNDVLLRQLSSIGLTYTQRKVQFNILYTHDDRESQSNLNQEEVDKNFVFGFTWQLQSRTEITLNHTQTDDEVLTADLLAENRLDELTINTIELNRQLSNNSDLSLLARNRERRSADTTLNYNETGYQINFSHRF